ncbi:MAG TPA: two-component system response regulator [Polyangiaceae bacterium]|nr:two-component system response regulator [Polyangiaceae bacterium]
MSEFATKPVVLIVDDAPESIDVLRGVLGADYQVKAAIHASVALELVESSPPDLILLDVMMPDMDGYEVCRRLKDNPLTAGIPIIFVTTLSDAGSEARGLELGAVDYITKPYVPSLVRSRVRTHVTLHRHSLSLEAQVRERTAELLETRLEIIRRLGRAGEYRDNETGMHVLRMSHIARLVALRLGVSEGEAELVLQAAPMHDVGKIGIPDRILLKPGPLDRDEWDLMKRHTTIGAEIIGDHPSELLRTARVIALRHHERWDGSGYPDGLSGEAIPKIARVVAIADVFDALLSERPYKAPWTVEATVATLREQSGRHFEPSAVAALLEVLPECLALRAKYSDD